jgi:hypothetical protein
MSRLSVVILLLPALVGLAGCAKEGADSARKDASSKGGIEKTAERGPVRLSVRTDKSEITIAERLTLVIEVTAPEGVEVHMPAFGKQLNEFQIRDFRDEPARVVPDGLRWRQTYDLDIFLSGEYALPGIEVQFTDTRDKEPIESTVATEPFSIKVTSLLAGDFDPTAFRDIKGPATLPPKPMSAARKGLIAATAVAPIALIAAVWVWRRRRKQKELIILPHEWAFDQLRRLIDEQLVEQGLVHEFYFRLSRIIRQYIERRFGVMAAERTTEEFLEEARSSPSLSREHQALLGEFLAAADMVKFARYQPDAREIERAFDTARDFIEQTVESAPTRAASAPVEAAA